MSERQLFSYLQASARDETNPERKKRLYDEIIRTFGQSDEPEAGEWMVWAMQRRGEILNYPEMRAPRFNPTPFYPVFSPIPPPAHLDDDLAVILHIRDGEERLRRLDGYIAARLAEGDAKDDSLLATASIERVLTAGTGEESIGLLHRLAEQASSDNGLVGRRAVAWARSSIALSARDRDEKLAQLDAIIDEFAKDEDEYLRILVVGAMLRKSVLIDDKDAQNALYDRVLALSSTEEAWDLARASALLGKARLAATADAAMRHYARVIDFARGPANDSLALLAAEAWYGVAELQSLPEDRIAVYNDGLRFFGSSNKSALRKRLVMMRQNLVEPITDTSPR